MEILKTIETLLQLHSHEENLRNKALVLISSNEKIVLHLEIVQQAMDLADVLRKFPTDDEDLKVIQVLGMRIFNAFASSFQLALSGYSQNSALILRDILETGFLLDMFAWDRSLITEWRKTDEAKRNKKFGPVHVRKCLDSRDGNVKKHRADHYKVFSELAGHPTMKSAYMLRHEQNGDAHIGPFISKHLLEIVITEMGSLAHQATKYLDEFFPENYESAKPLRTQIRFKREQWFKTFLLKDQQA